MANPQIASYLRPHYTSDGKRDPKRRYIDTSDPNLPLISRRKAEALTEKEKARREKAPPKKQRARRQVKDTYTKYGSYKTLEDALADDRIQDESTVFITAYGRYSKTPKTGTSGKKGYLDVSGHTSYEGAKAGKSMTETIQNNIQNNYEEVEKYFIWVKH